MPCAPRAGQLWFGLRLGLEQPSRIGWMDNMENMALRHYERNLASFGLIRLFCEAASDNYEENGSMLYTCQPGLRSLVY